MDYSGQQFEHYQLIAKLGQGGMATVYKAYDTRLERDVAIKVVRKESIPPEQLERILKRFEREAKALAKFIHPNIVPVHDYGEFDGAPFLVMAYLSGGTLKERIGKPVPVRDALGYVIPIASALSYAHQRGVIHRDVKPSNILTTEEGGLMLSDFGIAQILEEATTQLTATGMGVGTPEYMAPEQWQGQATAASDQYALGVVFYELLTGKKPFSAETPLAVALKVMSEPLPRPSDLVPEIPEEVEKVLYKALARNPQDRYADMEVLRKALECLLSGHTELPGEANTEKLVGFVDEILEEKTPKRFPLSASENEKIGFNSIPLESQYELEGEGETLDVLDSTPSDKEKILSHVLGDSKKAQEGSSNGTDSKELSNTTSNKFPKKGKQVVIRVIGVILVLCVIIVIVIIIVSFGKKNESNEQINTAESDIGTTPTIEATQFSMIDTNATEAAQKTYSAQSQATAVAQVAWDIYNDYLRSSNLVYETGYGALEHENDGYLEIYWTDQRLTNFAIEATFQNPYGSATGSWDFGILFRHTASNDQYRLCVDSSGYWEFINRSEESWEELSNGSVDVNTWLDEENFLQILAVDDKGWFFLNGQFISELDLSDRDFAGDIGIGIEFLGNGTEGFSTTFTDLTIYTTEKSGIPVIQIEEKDGMNFLRVVDENQELDYTIGPVSSSKITDYKITVSPNNRCFAYIIGSTVYYSVIGESSIYVAGDISNFLIIQEGGSGESEFIDLRWADWENRLVVDDTSRGYGVSEFYASFSIAYDDLCFGD